MSFVAELEPRILWKHFDKILEIPRGSGEEEKMREYVIQMAKKHGLSYDMDKTGNLVVRKPATPGKEQVPAVILQAHLDMVNDKNSDVDHNFKKDPIIPRRDGDFIKASGTTLGSDNGIGVASLLALMETTEVAHGPLELLFTIDEETGLTGASNIGDGLLTGKLMINTDSEEEGTLCVGCAGGGTSELLLPTKETEAPAKAVALKVKLGGFRGGHSGVEIHLQRGNATKLLVRSLYRILEGAGIKFRLANLEGGNKHNAIPREAFATVAVPKKAQEAFEQALQEEVEKIKKEYATVDPVIELTVTKRRARKAWDARSTRRALMLINSLPDGVQMMSNDIPDLVETSTNVAIVKSRKKGLYVLCSSRSSVDSALHALRDQIAAIARLAGAEVKEDEAYPGWKPDLSSEMLQVSKKVHKELFGKDPEVMAIHAGLECGIIGEKYGGMDMVSMGPTIQYPHSPDERVSISSVENYYKLLTNTLSRLAA